MGWLKKIKNAVKDVVEFEGSNLKNMWDKVSDNPERLLLGAADPLGSKIWGKALNKDYEDDPIVNIYGGPTEDSFQQAEAKGIDTGFVRDTHKLAELVASAYGGKGVAKAGGALGRSGGTAIGEMVGGHVGGVAGGNIGQTVLGTAAAAAPIIGGSIAANDVADSSLSGDGPPTDWYTPLPFDTQYGPWDRKVNTEWRDDLKYGQSADSVEEAMFLDSRNEPYWLAAPPVISEEVPVFSSGGYTGDSRSFKKIAGDPLTYGQTGGEQVLFTGGDDGLGFRNVVDNARARVRLESPEFKNAVMDRSLAQRRGENGNLRSMLGFTTPAQVNPAQISIPAIASQVSIPRGIRSAEFAQGGSTGYLSSAHTMGGTNNGRSDKIPAKVSPNEYIIDAESVSLLGDGSPDAGANRLDQMIKKIRMHKGDQLSRGKFSDNAMNPEDYLDEDVQFDSFDDFNNALQEA